MTRSSPEPSGEPESSDDRSHLERRLHEEGYRRIAGVDEAGRGCLAGPVVAAAVLFPPGRRVAGVRDSKRLSPERRDELLTMIRETALCVETARVEPAEIDRINILQAALKAMQMAGEALRPRPDYLLVDGNKSPSTLIPHQSIVGGDDRSHTIAAASIVAKVVRDRYMIELAEQYPQYGWERHKGYPTAGHYTAIDEHGPSPHHRRSFRLKRSG